MKRRPLVTVICLCHNQAPYVKDAIASIRNQSYQEVELIVVDDGSTDGSKQVILETLDPGITFINIETPVGNCKAFNKGFRHSSGSYLIDLAADDLLLPQRVEYGVTTFESNDIGVEFCNVENIDASGNSLGNHFSNHEEVPDGNIYMELISRYFISPPGMMISRDVLEALGGYDESLTYEDFDFWIRSSRNYTYKYTDKMLVQKRLLQGSLSKKQNQFLSRHQQSTLKVCQKIKALNRTDAEKKALKKRTMYEIKQCVKQGNVHLIPAFLKLL